MDVSRWPPESGRHLPDWAGAGGGGRVALAKVGSCWKATVSTVPAEGAAWSGPGGRQEACTEDGGTYRRDWAEGSGRERGWRGRAAMPSCVVDWRDKRMEWRKDGVDGWMGWIDPMEDICTPPV